MRAVAGKLSVRAVSAPCIGRRHRSRQQSHHGRDARYARHFKPLLPLHHPTHDSAAHAGMEADASSGIAKRPFKKKMAPFKGPFVFTWLVGSHAVVVMMMMVMMVMHFPSLCARYRGHGERHGGEGGQHESKLLHRNLSLGWILLVRGR
jgi:hypothetical protein